MILSPIYKRIENDMKNDAWNFSTFNFACLKFNYDLS